MLLAPSIVPGILAWTAKVHAKVPGGEPAIRGLLVLSDLATGASLAVMDSVGLTTRRTALAAALGPEALARPDTRRLLLVGAGARGGRSSRRCGSSGPSRRFWCWTPIRGR